jgi:thymidylate synthase
MSKVDQEFQKLCKKIVNEGKVYENKNRGVKRLQIPSYTFRHDFNNGFPAITNKKLYWKGIAGELIWFLRGDNDVKYLNDNGIKIWNKDAFNWHKKHGGVLTFQDFEKKGIGSV